MEGLDLLVTEPTSGSARPQGRAVTTEYCIVCPEKESVMERERERMLRGFQHEIMGYTNRGSKHVDVSWIGITKKLGGGQHSRRSATM